MSQEDISTAVEGLTEEQVWRRPGGVASVGFHLAHLSGSTERLLTYSRGEALSAQQLEALARERLVDGERPPSAELLYRWHAVANSTIGHLAATDESTLPDPRTIGRAQLPSTVIGVLFHVAEHASRHTGQLITTARLVRHPDPTRIEPGAG
jgi:uncharacterized damage-inducible protein DinB